MADVCNDVRWERSEVIVTPTCNAKIRPFPNDIEVECTKELPHSVYHQGIIHDQAYPGSETTLTWQESDRRTYHGRWPGECEKTGNCAMPDGHHGDCAP